MGDVGVPASPQRGVMGILPINACVRSSSGSCSIPEIGPENDVNRSVPPPAAGGQHAINPKSPVRSAFRGL
jgi:hypothetical protein